MRLKSEMAVFETHRIRGVLRLRNFIISLDWRVYGAAARALLSQFARRIGIATGWAKDRPRPYAIAVHWSGTDRDYVDRGLAGRADAIIADYMFQAEAFSCPAAAGLPKAIIMHDLFHARGGRNSAGESIDSVALVSREREIELLSKADAVVAIQATEAAFLLHSVPSVRTILAPMAARPVPRPQIGDGRKLLFIGSNTAPNVSGLKWFFDCVWPILRSQLPEVSLSVAGNVHLAFPEGAPRGVRFHGLVDDLGSLYEKAGIVVSPLTFGSGLKIKLIEAMAQGKAIVATSVTLQGVERECASSVIVTDDPNIFAGQIMELQQNEAARTRLATAALETARLHFSPKAAYSPFVEWLRQSEHKSGFSR